MDNEILMTILGETLKEKNPTLALLLPLLMEQMAKPKAAPSQTGTKTLDDFEVL
jgi:hypothetical protein